MTTKHAYNDFLNKLIPLYEDREAANITDWVFEKVTGLKRLERSINNTIELSNDAIQQLKKYEEELLLHKPVQYVLQEAWFYKMKFFVNEYVLIPRPETEELVEWIVEDAQIARGAAQHGERELSIIDIGTGSGCISISLKKEWKNFQITAIDISEQTIWVANKNADLLQVEINFLQIDFLDESLWNSFGVLDIIVSNPPYIPEAEKEKLAKNVTAFEPGTALFVNDNNPFIFYEKIAKFAKSHLNPVGKIYVEIHENYSKEVQEIFLKYNFQVEIKNDIYGRKRMIKAW